MNAILKGMIKNFPGEKNHYLFVLDVLFFDDIIPLINKEDKLIAQIDPSREMEIMIKMTGFPVFFRKIQKEYIFPDDGFDYENGIFIYRGKLEIFQSDTPVKYVAEIQMEDEFHAPEVELIIGVESFTYHKDPGRKNLVVDGEIEDYRKKGGLIKEVYDNFDINLIQLIIEVAKKGSSLSFFCNKCRNAQNIHSPTNLYCKCGNMMITSERTGEPLPQLSIVQINYKEGNIYNVMIHELTGCSGNIDDLIFVKVWGEWRVYLRDWRVYSKKPKLFLNFQEYIENTPLKCFDVLSLSNKQDCRLLVLPVEKN